MSRGGPGGSRGGPGGSRRGSRGGPGDPPGKRRTFKGDLEAFGASQGPPRDPSRDPKTSAKSTTSACYFRRRFDISLGTASGRFWRDFGVNLEYNLGRFSYLFVKVPKLLIIHYTHAFVGVGRSENHQKVVTNRGKKHDLQTRPFFKSSRSISAPFWTPKPSKMR